ncbi:type II toxin-antitoxin system RelE/ParE family toxin [Nitrospirillum sp. BR 11828]|uniref:type II toxin-antitoxin system RelE/ParE family toxin n=1 Tax=Nitrospirillum sp. BR 11828 TaxID=3104325 RepID=UPI002ACA74D2|nr:type II toxin-antitoxin system RelE/ParE family toxin [Nitrospirillum sp. BR 11828]MDZ5647779.1 type II toxin-antitoxin system RelE/ParE family toxin [Nitrospirillum sp. BR 11828]
MSVIWREDARDDIVRITAYIAHDNPVAAGQVARALFIAGESLMDFPRRGRPGRVAGTRELVAYRPYIIVYEIDAEGDVHILRVWHGAQDRL